MFVFLVWWCLVVFGVLLSFLVLFFGVFSPFLQTYCFQGWRIFNIFLFFLFSIYSNLWLNSYSKVLWQNWSLPLEIWWSSRITSCGFGKYISF